MDTCRTKVGAANATEDDTFYFKGCYTAFKDEVAENQELVVGIAIAVVVVMFLNILFSFSLCMMVKSWMSHLYLLNIHLLLIIHFYSIYVELYNRLSHVAENKREIIHKMSYLFNQLNSVEM